MGAGSLRSPGAPRLQTYYNEFDPFAAQWLRNLISKGLIAPGVVDDRPIQEVQPGDVFSRAHFFAGIGGWDLALQLAGWPSDAPVWTGSCPCQPFSAAGKRKGVEDPRHIWPEFRRLISECLPPVIFGEQVASADGRLWLDGVRSDLEALGYAVGAADLCSAGVGAPNIRQRLYWVACAKGVRLEGGSDRSERLSPEPFGLLPAGPSINAGGLGYWSDFDALPCLDGRARRIEPGSFPLAHGVPGRVGLLRGYGNAINPQVAAEFIRAFLEAAGLPEAASAEGSPIPSQPSPEGNP